MPVPVPARYRSTFILNRERAVDYLNTLDHLYGATLGHELLDDGEGR